MKTLKKIAIILIAIITLPLIAALFLEKDYKVQREIIVEQPVDSVFNYIKYLKNQDNFSKWANMDPDMKKEYRGTDAAVGFVSAWESKKDDVGKGEQEIIKITQGQRIDYELRFIEPFEATENAYITTEKASSSSTKVIWGFNGHMNYPMNLMLVMMDFEDMIGNDLQTGLNTLKKVLEKNTK
jgi:hypothetical protein